MDSTNTASVTDDQELAKVLENMNQQATAGAPVVPTVDDTVAEPSTTTDSDDVLSFEETPGTPVTTEEVTPDSPVVDANAEAAADAAVQNLVTPPETPDVTVAPTAAQSSPELDSIKKTALEELRPLVDKLDLPADEKFDTLLLLIRSTDDKTLVSAAHEAARAIEDETKRAQALLDVIKEIDYFSGHGQQPA
jgi:hypothetical protein